MRKILIALISILLLLSCSKEKEGTIARGLFDVTLNAELPEMAVIDTLSGTDTKAATQYTVRVKWVKGDKISVVNLTTGKIIGGQLTANSAGSSTTFSGSLNGTINSGDRIMFLYPAQNNSLEVDYEKINVDLSSQEGKISTPLCVYSVITATGDTFNNTSISFSFLMCYMMIAMSDIPASSFINSVTLCNVTNSIDIAINSDKTDINITPNIGNMVLSPSSAASSTGKKTVYAAIPASPSGYIRHIILETEHSTFSVIFSSSAIQNGKAYNTNVSGFLVDHLTLADESMQEYCLKHFDSNGDGKLSMVEIAGVTKFPDQTTYPIPSSILEFNELEHFHSLTELPSFKNCTKLGSITIPQQIDLIPSETFYGCTSLVKVTLKPTDPPILGTDVFVGQAGELILIVADDSVEKYQTADGWKDFFNNFRTESNQGDSKVDIETEDDDQMDNERIEITVE